MASTAYQTYEAALGHTPLQYPYGQAWLKAHGSVKDFLADRLRLAIKQRFAGLATPDALAALGVERQILRGPGEGDAAYAGRVAAAWASWPYGGTAFGVLSQLYAAGYKSVVLLSRTSQYTLDVNGALVQTAIAGAGWQPSTLWSTFSVIVTHPWPVAWLAFANWAATVSVGTGSGTVSSVFGFQPQDVQYTVLISTGGAAGVGQYKVSTDGGLTFGAATTLAVSGNVLSGQPTFSASGTFTLGDRYYISQTPPGDASADANLFRAIIKNWKPAHATCVGMTVLQTGRLLGYPIRTLGSSNGVLGGSSITSWTPPAN